METLTLHATAFGLFLVGVIVNVSFLVHYFLNYNGNERAENEYLNANTFLQFCNFISECCLCAIFWQLSNNLDKPQTITEENTDDEESDIAPIYTEPYDEDAELQARVWNGFQRLNHGLIGSQDSRNSMNDDFSNTMTTVTPQQIMRSFNRLD